MRICRPYNEKDDLKLLAQGNEEAFARLFEHYRRQIFGVALRFLKSRELAEEVLQETFLKIWMKREELVTVVNFKGYLFTMSRNLVFDSIKNLAKETATKREFAHDVHRAQESDHLLIEKEYQALLQEVVDQLPIQQKRIFRLAKIEGLSHQAIAEQLHISRLTVKTHMAKALQTIRQNLHRHITTLVLLPVILHILNL